METLLTSYEHQVEDWVRAALERGATSLDDVVAALPGVYPSVARDVLRRVAPLMEQVSHSRLVLPFGHGQRHMTSLPAPHPLDYDWRFHDEAVALLLAQVDTLATPGDSVVLLGTPSILHTVRGGLRPYTFTLLDANVTMINWFAQSAPTAQVQHCVIGQDALPPLTGSVVIADPPWYEEHIRAFLWAASQICTLRGTILISLPPVGTRPGIAEEWARVLDWAEQLGLVLFRMERSALAYKTPPFEHNALKVEEMAMVTPTWRRGDLAIFTCQYKRHVPYPFLPMIDGVWDEVCVDGVRVRLRRRQVDSLIDPTLHPLIDGHILPSVSRRDPRRRHADIWTTGNRIFVCRRTDVVRIILQAFVDGVSPLNKVSSYLGRPLNVDERVKVTNASHQIDAILTRERREIGEFWQGSIDSYRSFPASCTLP